MENNRKGIVLAGGSGSRLYPLTKSTSKQLLAVYDKPLIYYSLSTLMLAGIQEILVISNEESLESYRNLLGNGSRYGVELNYLKQDSPEGIAQAFHIGEDFIGSSNVALVLGDNLFFGQDFEKTLIEVSGKEEGSTVFGYHVDDPQRFGVVTFDTNSRKVKKIEEKPKNPDSNFAITGLYFYDSKVVEYAKSLEPSARGEYEITDLNNIYLEQGQLNVEILDRGFTWLDAGTPDSLLEAGQLVKTVESRQGLKIGCLEEISLQKGWLSAAELSESIKNLAPSSYVSYLKKISK